MVTTALDTTNHTSFQQTTSFWPLLPLVALIIDTNADLHKTTQPNLMLFTALT